MVYYCCQTTYIADEYDAFQWEMGERSYLCWTITQEISCVIEYSTEAVEYEDIFRMAECVLLPTK